MVYLEEFVKCMRQKDSLKINRSRAFLRGYFLRGIFKNCKNLWKNKSLLLLKYYTYVYKTLKVYLYNCTLLKLALRK